MQRRISQFRDKNGESWPKIETEAPNLTQAFVEAAHALMDLILPDHENLKDSVSVPIFCESMDLEFLLADWINTLVFEMNQRGIVFTRFDIHVEGIHVKGKAFGVKWSEVKEKVKMTELQGVAFDELSVQETTSGCRLSLVLNDRARHPLRLGVLTSIFVSALLFFSSCTTVQEKKDIRAGLRTPVADYSKKKLIESFDLLNLVRVALDGTNLCRFQGEEMMTIPQNIRARIDSWAKGLSLDDGLPSVQELNDCASSCRCSSYVYWLDQKGAYPSELSKGYQNAVAVAAKMKNAQALACAKKAQTLCASQTLKDYR